MTAEQMFKELGYTKITNLFELFNIERYITDEKAIDFYKDSKTMAIGTLEVNAKEINAIYQRCLNWGG